MAPTVKAGTRIVSGPQAQSYGYLTPAVVVTRGCEQILVAVLLAGCRPVTPARLQQPQAANILQQPNRPADAAFIGEVQIARLRRDDRGAQLGAKQRPGA